MTINLIFNNQLRKTIKITKIMTLSDRKPRYVFESNDRFYCTTDYSICYKDRIIGYVLYDRYNKKAIFKSK